ncbi:hypothetical protein [Hyphomicrobium sp.]|uniref:hypothetical protein n=1 Tax=Hyphomicrobium sp. TaxID=82 RepID=UPI002D78EAC4|nr:hypothetical protein [Hyphomicrobium sp.]HET6389289.1 hypothetical protein [Hyphomicrobium sp.]
MYEEFVGCSEEMAGKVAAIPCATTSYGEAITELILCEGGRVALGASPLRFDALDGRIDGREGAHCQPVDLDRPASMSEFFHIAFAQFERIDVVVLELGASKRQRMTPDKAIELGTRRLLYCLDAVLPYAGRDLHLICVGPASGPAGIPIATAFLAAKFATMQLGEAPCVRMSIVSPPEDASTDEGALARTIVHLMKETRSPDIIEAVVSPNRRQRRHMRRPRFDGRGKMFVPAP